MHTPENLQEILRQQFGYSQFRPGQLEIIESILGGHNTLALMPTGGGKSLCFQVPGLAMEGTTVVISPLIALMKDQVDALRQNGLSADFLNSTQDTHTQMEVLNQVHSGKLKFLYIAPEKLFAQHAQVLDSLRTAHINLFAIDEAHCISQWGHDFRPEYMQLAALQEFFPDTPKVALTATADTRTRESIIQNLNWPDPSVFISSFNRPNISYHVQPKQNSKERLLQFLEQFPDESGIIYTLSRKSTEKWASFLENNGHSARPYHAGLSREVREDNQEAFIRDKVKIMVATIAFGMGIDKSNVRFVVHMDLPKNIEGYYQETGRAGRDGLPSKAMLLFSRGDAATLQSFIDAGDPENAVIMTQKLNDMIRFGESSVCRRKYLLNYFDEHFEAPCGGCDHCLNEHETIDGTIIAQKALSAVYRLKERFGMGYVIDFLRGSKAEKIKTEHRAIKTYGVGKDISKSEWRMYFQNLIELGHLALSDGNYPILLLTPSSRDVLQGFTTVELKKPFTSATEDSANRRTRTTETLDYDPELYKLLKQWRLEEAQSQNVPPYVVFSDKTLAELAYYMPMQLDEVPRISGFGAVKTERYGAALLEKIKGYGQSQGILSSRFPDQKPAPKTTPKSTKPKPGGLNRTQLETVQLFEQGKSIAEIAQERALSATTVEGHLACGITEGKIDLEQLINPAKQEAIAKAIREFPTVGLKPIKDLLGDAYSYGEIKFVQAHLRKS